MDFKFSKSLRIYFITVMSVLTLTFIGGGVYYYSAGAFNAANMETLYSAQQGLSDLNAKDLVTKISTLIMQDEARSVTPVVSELKQDAKRITSSIDADIPEFNDLEKHLNLMQKAVNGMVAVPEIKQIVKVFSERVDEFVTFVSDNNWRTLTRVSKRLQSRVSNLMDNDTFAYVRASADKRAFVDDIRTMRKVTLNSILSRENKELITEKLDSLKTEIVLMDNYLDALAKYNRTEALVKQSYESWHKAVEPSIALNKINAEQSSQNVFYGIAFAIGLMVLVTGVSIPVMGHLAKTGASEIEDRIINVIRKGVIPFESQLSTVWGSPAFIAEIDKFHDYVHKRMSFGSIFQEAMPFSSLLLDSNLNMIWANSDFYEDFGIKKDHFNSSVTWDYLQKFTNLGEDDPVLLAQTRGIAGIYQIQVKTDKSQEALPYEMYVSPVEYAGQTRTMVMFYPLRSLEETISAQTKAIINPVKKTIDAITNEEFNDAFVENISHDYESAGIENLLDSFKEFKEIIDNQSLAYLSNIQNLETQKLDTAQTVDSLRNTVEEQGYILQEMMKSLKNTKQSIIETIELRGKIEDQYLATVSNINELFYEQDDLLNEASKAFENLNTQEKVFKNMNALRADFRETRDGLLNFRNIISESLIKVSMSAKRVAGSDELTADLDLMKADMKRFDKSLGFLAEVLQQSDIWLSKLDIIMQNSDAPNFAKFKDSFSEYKAILEKDVTEFTHMTASASDDDDALVMNLKEQFSLYKATVQKMRFMEDALNSECPVPENSDYSEAPQVSV